MKKVYMSDETTMVLESLKNIYTNHMFYDSYYEEEVPDYFHVHVSGNAKVFDEAIIYGNARAFGNVEVSGSARVFGEAKVFGNATVQDYAEISGNAEVSGNARVCDNARIFDNAIVYDNAKVAGNARVCENAEATTRVINIIGFPCGITITDNHISIGCKQFDFKTAKKLAERNIDIDEEEYKEMITHKELLLSLIETKEKELKKDE